MYIIYHYIVFFLQGHGKPRCPCHDLTRSGMVPIAATWQSRLLPRPR